MEFRILGPFEVHTERGAVPLGGVKPRTVLAVLLLHANEPVSAERLALALWGEDAPAGAVKTVQVHVSRLRKALGNGEIVETTAAGYCLRVRPGELDAERFEHLVEDGRQALSAGRPEEASSVLRDALRLWRGSPLAELAFEPFAQAEIARLEEQRLAAIEARVEADLVAGREAELIGELQHLVAEHPSRERLAGQLMLALYRCGRQTDALNTYRDTRHVLVTEMGLEPGPELRRLHEAILHQDASLEPAPAGALDLPRELDAAAAPPLEGRSAELAWLRERWEEARAGAGALITLVGERGSGKTRLLAELAGEAHDSGDAVLYAAGNSRSRTVLRRARETTRSTLLVVDDADQADGEVRAALDALGRAIATVPVLALVSGRDEEALARIDVAASVVLLPLDVEAVRAIAVRYAPGQAHDDVPADWLLEASGGVPARVHELAGQWARREAAHRVGVAAGRAAAGRVELRTMEAELAGGVEDLQTAREHDALIHDDDAPPICPFKGLASFELTDAEYFFGRERLIAELVARLVGAPLLGVVGPSGSGKSSVVRAGLLPALAAGVLPDSEHWTQVLMRPGEHPLHELSDAVAGLGGDGRLVLAVDQFEETFTACRDEEERTGFIAALVRAARGPPHRTVVVIAVRADYYGRCAAYPELSALLAANNVLVRPMQREELSKAIELPAARAGLRVDPELTDALVADTADEPGALPLLSTALLELWQTRHGRRLRHADYEHTGGVRGAVARLAERAFERLDDAQRAVARSLLLRLAGEGADGGVERRRVPLAELDSGDDEALASVIALLTDQRLLTVSAGTVEVAHEALLREWPRLRGWLDEDREGLRIQRRLTAAAQEWRRLDRDDDALYRGARLAEALEWRKRSNPTLNQLETDFLNAGAARQQRERTTRRRNLRLAFGALAAALAAISVVAAVAIHQRNDAKGQRNIALSGALALQSAKTVDSDPGLALKLGLWALDTSPTDEADAAVRQAMLAYRQLAVLPADSVTAETAAYSPDGRQVVTGGDDGIVRVWDAVTHRVVARWAARHGVAMAARYSPRGDQLVLGFGDGTVVISDRSLSAPREALSVKGKAVQTVAFSGDGRLIAAAFDDGTVTLVAVDGSKPTRTLQGHDILVNGVDVDADGSRVVTAGDDGTVQLWSPRDAGTPRVLHRGALPEMDVHFSPRGDRIVAVGFDGRVRLWNGQTGVEERHFSGQGRLLRAAGFSRDGRRLAATGSDGVIRVWDVGGGPPVAVLRGQGSRIFDVGFGASSDRLVSAGDDGTVKLWDAGRTQAWVAPSRNANIDFSPDGRLLVGGAEDGTVRIWDTATRRVRSSLPGPEGYTSARFSPTADTVVVGRFATSSVSTWPVSADHADTVAKLKPGSGINTARFDSTGQRIVYVAATGGLVVHDLRSGRDVRLGDAPEVVWDAQISPDGNHVAAIPDRGDVLVWRLDHPARPERTLKGHRGDVNTIGFSKDGRIVTAGADRTARVWSVRGGPGIVLRGHDDEVTTAIFTADGTQVLTSSQDGTLRLWDAHTGHALAVLQSGEDPVIDVVLSRDGRIATLDLNQAVRIFRCDVCGSLRQVRALAQSRAPGELTPQEKRRFLAAVG